jgi:hypothetical protein
MLVTTSEQQLFISALIIQGTPGNMAIELLVDRSSAVGA